MDVNTSAFNIVTIVIASDRRERGNLTLHLRLLRRPAKRETSRNDTLVVLSLLVSIMDRKLFSIGR